MNLNTPTIVAGPLTAADLDAARKHSTGQVFNLHRITLAGRDTCNGTCQEPYGCDCHAEACAVECARHADPVPTGPVGPLLGILLVLTGWPLVAALVALLLFIIEHMPKIQG